MTAVQSLRHAGLLVDRVQIADRFDLHLETLLLEKFRIGFAAGALQVLVERDNRLRGKSLGGQERRQHRRQQRGAASKLEHCVAHVDPPYTTSSVPLMFGIFHLVLCYRVKTVGSLDVGSIPYKSPRR